MPGRLIVRRPSPTTVSFTVSNASSRSSSPAKLLFYLQILLRALLLISTLFLSIAKLRHIPVVHDWFLINWEAIWVSPLGAFACRIVDSYSALAVAVVNALVIYGVFRKGYTGMSRSSTCLASLMFTNMVFYRGIASGYSRTRYPNFNFLCNILIQSCDAIHTDHPNTGYCNS